MRSKIKNLAILCCFASIQSTQAGEFPSSILTAETDAFIHQVLVDWKSPGGASVAVVRKIPRGVWKVETKGYGIATYNRSKVTENTLFSIGSNSKV